MEIKKAIIPIAGLGTRFLPLSKVLPKELWPLVDKPVIQYIVEEAIASGIKEIIFVSRPGKRIILDYFAQNFSFSQVNQKKPLGDGHAILQAKKKIDKTPVAVLFGDDVVESKIPCLLQLIKIFKKYQKPVIALYRIPKKNLPSYGVARGEKIGKGVYRIKKIIEKPEIKKAPSNLAIVGKYILTPEVFDYLSSAKPGKNGEISLAENLEKMIKDKKEILGYEFEGKWLECGNKLAYLKSNLYLSLKHPQFGKELKQFLKQTEGGSL